MEEIGPVTAGANLGWNDWEGSYRYLFPTILEARVKAGKSVAGIHSVESARDLVEEFGKALGARP